MGTTNFAAPVVATTGLTDEEAPLVVLLHGRGSRETDIIGLAESLPGSASYVALRAPIAEGGGFAWFANRGIGRPVADSLRETMRWFHEWLEEAAAPERPVLLVGFSGGAAFAGALVLDRPMRFAGAAILYGTMPFDAGLDTGPGRLAGMPMFLAQGEHDRVIPLELQQRTWRYLHDESGAQVRSHRDDAGHALSPAALHELAVWLGGRTPRA